MMNRAIFKHISFLFITGCIWLPYFSFISHAATVQITEKDILLIDALSKNPSDKHKPPSPPKNTIHDYQPTSMRASPKKTKSIMFKKQQVAYSQPSLKEIGKTLVTENSDNKHVQDALATYTKAKQFHIKTDEILTNFSQDLVLKLELDQSFQSTLLLLHLNYNNNPYSATNYQPDLQRINSFNSNLHAAELFSYDEEPNNIFAKIYKQIFQIKNLFYLSALMLFSPILKWFLKQLFMQRY